MPRRAGTACARGGTDHDQDTPAQLDQEGRGRLAGGDRRPRPPPVGARRAGRRRAGRAAAGRLRWRRWRWRGRRRPARRGRVQPRRGQRRSPGRSGHPLDPRAGAGRRGHARRAGHLGGGQRCRLRHPRGQRQRDRARGRRLLRQGRCHRPAAGHALLVPLQGLPDGVDRGPREDAAHRQCRAGEAGGVLLRQLSDRLLQRLCRGRQARRGRGLRPRRAPGRLPLRIRPRPVRERQRPGAGPGGRAAAGNRGPGGLPAPLRAVPLGRRPAAAARAAADDRRVGRPRDRERRLAGRRAESPAGDRGRLRRAPGRRGAGLARVAAGARWRRSADDLPRLRLRLADVAAHAGHAGDRAQRAAGLRGLPRRLGPGQRPVPGRHGPRRPHAAGHDAGGVAAGACRHRRRPGRYWGSRC